MAIFSAAVGGEQRLIGAHGPGEQLHRSWLHLPGLVPIVHAVVHADVGTKRFAACPAARNRLGLAGPRPVSRYAERKIAASVKVLDRFAYGTASRPSRTGPTALSCSAFSMFFWRCWSK
jgi:hypothetical protein